MAIQSFKDDDLACLYAGKRVGRFRHVERVVLRKLRQLDIAGDINDLRVPPGNRLEKLTGDRSGQHSIRVNAQWRLCFTWKNGGAWNVEIVDYH